MNKKELKQNALDCINMLESGATFNRSIMTCYHMTSTKYLDFLYRENILYNIGGSIYLSRFSEEEVIEANLFRMMCVTEFCRQSGVKI
jgi:hypothetical protein